MATNVERVYKDYLAAKNSHDVAKIAALWTEDCVVDEVAIGHVTRSRKELKALLNDIFVACPDVKWELKSLFSAGDRIAVEWVETGTPTGDLAGIPATGKSYLIRGASLIEVREGKISRLTSYWNMADVLQQLGLMPKTPLK